MQPRDPQELPEDLQPVADWLRAQRPEVSALDLDRIKQRALARASRGEPRGLGLARPRRSVATVLSALVLTASLGGALAIAGKAPPTLISSGSSVTSASKTQYKPGKGCGKPGQHRPPPPGPPKPCP